MPSDQSDRMWYYDEIAQRFGISTRTLQNWIQAGKISPLVDPTDTRRRILRDRDVEKLAKMFGRSDESTTIFQKVARLEDAYGPFDVTAKALLTLAVEMSNGHVLRGLYVLRAAIANQWPGIPSLTTPLLNKLLTDQSIRNAHESSIHRALSKLDTRATQVGDDTPLSELAASGLISALSAARLASQPDPTSFAALLRAIVLDDQEVLQVLEDIPNPLRIPRGELIRELDIVRPPRASDGLSSGAAAYAPSATARYSKRHAVVMNGILEGLAFREPSTIVVCYGLSGSPIDRVHKILADLIEQSNFFGFTGQLGGYVQLLTLDVGQLQLRQPLDAQQQLLEALRQAEKQDAILLITRLHLLAPDLIQARPQVDNAILQVLANTGSAAVIALHEQESESSPTPDSNFRALSMTLVECPKYSLEQTLSMIKNYYAVEWKARDSVTVDNDAIQGIFAFERATWAQQRRRTLPYLAIELAGEAIATVRATITGTTSGLLFGLFKNAEGALESVEEQTDKLSREIEPYLDHEDVKLTRIAKQWTTIAQELEVSRRVISEGLGDVSRVIEADSSSLLVIKRALIDAQFFGVRKYQLNLLKAFRAELDGE